MKKMGKKWGLIAAAMAVGLAGSNFASVEAATTPDAGTLMGEQQNKHDFGKPGRCIAGVGGYQR